MGCKFIFNNVIYLFVVLVALLGQESLKGQPIKVADGVSVNYVWTIGESGRVEVSNMASMYYCNDKSVFLTSPQEGSAEFNTDDVENMTATIHLKTTEGQVYFMDRKADTLIAKEVVLDGTVNVEEDMPEFSWQITGEQKVIAERNCYEATTSFRGRSYSAWFTPDIPLDVGPWKFSGLPGAILEVTDKEGRYNWYCKSIRGISPEEKLLIKAPKSKKTYSFAQYQNLYKEKLVAHLNKMVSNSGVSITSEVSFDAWLERTPE